MGAQIFEQTDITLVEAGSETYSIAGPVTAGSTLTVTLLFFGDPSGSFTDFSFTQGTPSTVSFPESASTPIGTITYDGDTTFTITITNMPSYYQWIGLYEFSYNCPDAQSITVSHSMSSNSAYAYQLPSTPKEGTPISIVYYADGRPDHKVTFKGGYAGNDFVANSSHIVWFDGIDTIGFATTGDFTVNTIAYIPSGSDYESYGFYADKSKAPLGMNIGVTCAVLLEDETIAATSEGSLVLKIPVATNIDENNQITPIGVLGIYIDRDSTEMSALNSVAEYFYTVSDIDEDGYMQVILGIANVPNRSVVFQAPGTMMRLSFIKR